MSEELKKKKKKWTGSQQRLLLVLLFQKPFAVFLGFVKEPSNDFPGAHGPQLQLMHNLKNLPSRTRNKLQVLTIT